MHTECLKRGLFSDFNEEKPDKLISLNIGVNARRWIHCANPDLADLFTKALGGDNSWLKDISLLKFIIFGLGHDRVKKCWDRELFRDWQKIKVKNKRKLINKKTGFSFRKPCFFFNLKKGI